MTGADSFRRLSGSTRHDLPLSADNLLQFSDDTGAILQW